MPNPTQAASYPLIHPVSLWPLLVGCGVRRELVQALSGVFRVWIVGMGVSAAYAGHDGGVLFVLCLFMGLVWAWGFILKQIRGRWSTGGFVVGLVRGRDEWRRDIVGELYHYIDIRRFLWKTLSEGR